MARNCHMLIVIIGLSIDIVVLDRDCMCLLWIGIHDTANSIVIFSHMFWVPQHYVCSLFCLSWIPGLMCNIIDCRQYDACMIL
jgi:hypothetical protein